MSASGLRPYQQDAVDGIRAEYRGRHRSVLFVLPTGGGKTVLFTYMVKAAAARDKRCLVVAHRKELIEQASETFTGAGIEHGVIMAGRSRNRLPVQVGMVGTVARRLDKIDTPDFIVIDEAHHTTANTYRKILEAFPSAHILGVTATPQRTDGTGLGELFSSMVVGPSMRELVEGGFLAHYRLFIPPDAQISTGGISIKRGDFDQSALAKVSDTPTITGDAVKHYRRLCDGGRAVAFCVSVEHASHVAEYFNGAGIPAEFIHGGSTPSDRAESLRRLATGEIKVVTSCDLISEGFDLPAVEAAILLRPTQSLIVFLQQVGRVLRPAPGKEYAVILDHAGNAVRHGMPDDFREWSLEGRKKGEKKQLAGVSVTLCTYCFAAYRANLDRCPHCGSIKADASRVVEYQDGELVEVSSAELQRRSAEGWQRDEEIRGRKPVMWPMLNSDAGLAPASLTKATEGGRKGVVVRLYPGAVRIFRAFSSMPPDQLRVVGSAFGYKPFWAARTNFFNRHGRAPANHEITRAMAELSHRHAA